VELVVDGKIYQMKEVDLNDNNFSDGKGFMYAGTFEEGPKYYYFRCGNDSSYASTFNVKVSNFFDEIHPDLGFAMGIYIFPAICLLIVLRRLNLHAVKLSEILLTMHSAGNGPAMPATSGTEQSGEGSGTGGSPAEDEGDIWKDTDGGSVP